MLVAIAVFTLSIVFYYNVCFCYGSDQLEKTILYSFLTTFILLIVFLLVDDATKTLFFADKKRGESEIIHKMVKTPKGFDIYTLKEGYIVIQEFDIENFNVNFLKSNNEITGHYVMNGLIRQRGSTVTGEGSKIKTEPTFASYRSVNTIDIYLPSGFEYSNSYEMKSITPDDMMYISDFEYGEVDKVYFRNNTYEIFTYKNGRHESHKVKVFDEMNVIVENKEIDTGTYSFKTAKTKSGKLIKSVKDQYLKIYLPVGQKILYK